MAAGATRRRSRRARRGPARRGQGRRRRGGRAQGGRARHEIGGRAGAARERAPRPGQGGGGGGGGTQSHRARPAVGGGVRRPRRRHHRRRPEPLGRCHRAGAAGRVPEPAQPYGAGAGGPHLRGPGQPPAGDGGLQEVARGRPRVRAGPRGAPAVAGARRARWTPRWPRQSSMAPQIRDSAEFQLTYGRLLLRKGDYAGAADALAKAARLCPAARRPTPGSASRTSTRAAPRTRWRRTRRRSSWTRRTSTTARPTASSSASTSSPTRASRS